MNQSVKGIALLALLGAVVLAGCSEQPLGPESMGGNTAASAVASTGDEAPLAAARLRANLNATAADPLADGHSDFESRGARRKFSTEVEDVSVSGTGQVRVTRSGQVILTAPIQINAVGFGDLNLDTQNGQQVPVMRAGDRVQVFNANNVLILQGALRRN